MILGEIFNPKNICLNLESTEKYEVFEELVDKLVSANASIKRESIVDAICEREQLMSTGIKEGIALPHCKTDQVSNVTGILGVSKGGIEYDSLDNKPVHLVFMILTPTDSSDFHLRVLRHLANVIEAPGFVSQLMNSKNPDEAYSILCNFDLDCNK